MSNKQKLPKHITAHEDLQLSMKRAVYLGNKKTGLFTAANAKSPISLSRAVEYLNSGCGMAFNQQRIGKQIVF